MRFRDLSVVFFIAVFACTNTDNTFGNSNIQLEDFEGPEFCINCHEDEYVDWLTSGHHFIMMAAENAQNRPLPVPGGSSWEDISYVVGGYKTKALYLDTNGYFITQTLDQAGQPVNGRNQYNLLPGEWSDYHAGAESLPYNCGSCHNTAWVADEDWDIDGTLEDNQDGLPGIHGTFFAPGVQCEQCHGPGNTMSVDTSAESCGKCHLRGDVSTIPASNGFIQNHQQYNEHLAGPHRDSDCVYCHNPHERSALSIKEDAQCGISCHDWQMESYSRTKMFKRGVTCDDCHMPYASLSAMASSPYEGDLKTHIFFIDTDPSANMFTEDGRFVKLDEEGQAAVTLDFVCQRCHQGLSIEDLAWIARDFHSRLFAITGTVEKQGGEPLANVGIEVLDGTGEFLIEISTDADGTWRSYPLPTGYYFVRTESNPLGFNRELYDDHLCLPASRCDEPVYVITYGTPLQIENADESGIDFVLDGEVIFRNGFE